MTILDNIYMEDRPTEIANRKLQVLQNKLIPLVKVLWSHFGAKDAMWDHENKIRELYSELFDIEDMI